MTPGALLFTALLFATGQDEAPPLFRSNDLLELTIETDFGALVVDRREDADERPARLRYRSADSSTVDLPLEVRARGKFRMQRGTCAFPPIRLDFPRDSVGATLFEGQNRLKLVTHCHDRDNYEQNLIEEFLVYRGYNLLTDHSFRVRLARITYLDTGGADPVTRFGFLIEDEEALAERLAGWLPEVDRVNPRHLDAASDFALAIYQYMVGNTDWSVVYLHNIQLVQTADGLNVPVPYDLDWSGLVDAPYARPDRSLRIRSVRQRIFRGFCRPRVDTDAVYRRIAALRAPFEALIRDQIGLEEGNVLRAVEYLDGFWEIFEDPRRRRREIENRCRRM